PADWPERVRRLGCAALGAYHRALPSVLVTQLSTAGLAVMAYTVNRPGRAKALWRRGVNSLFCDAPDRLL
ncbi:MAG TPA: glycerophosphodiester phosphodiesterase family protein, partial [Magnetospirillum sp.]|nr:glycerophosphodiester phosphodiesterase family protein [Magnetospirillum sp.]